MQNGASAQPQTSVDPSQFGEYSNWAKGELAKGHSADELHQTLQQSGVSNYGQAPAQAQGDGGNWFTHLLPTIGGIGGGLLGSVADVFSGPLGTIAGSAGGSALGKGLENALEGKNPVDANVIGAGLEGGIGAGVGGAVGKGLGAVGALAGKRAGALVSNGAKQAAIDSRAIALKDIPNATQIHLNANNSLDHVGKMGFDATNPGHVIQVGQNTNDALNSVLDNALGNSAPVDLSHYPQIIKDSLAKRGDVLDSFDPVRLSANRIGTPNTLSGKLLQSMEKLGMGTAKISSDPNELRTLTTNLGEMAQKYRGIDTPEARASYDAINEVRNNVKKALYNREDVNAALANTPSNFTAEDLGSQQLADHVNSTVAKAGSTGNMPSQDLLSEISRNIDVKNVGDQMNDVRQIATSNGAKARAAVDAGIQDPGQALTTNGFSSVVNAGGPLGKTIALAKHTVDNPNILSTIERIGKMGDKLKVGGKELPGIATMAGTALATTPNLGADPVALGSNGTIGGTMQDQSQQGTQGATDPNDLSGVLAHYVEMVNEAPQLASSLGPIIQNLFPLVQKQRLAASTANGLNSAYANAGGAQGTSGILSQISSLVPGTAANTYENQKKTAAAQLGAALGISPDQAAGILPSLMQNQQSAGLSQGVLGQLSGQLGG